MNELDNHSRNNCAKYQFMEVLCFVSLAQTDDVQESDLKTSVCNVITCKPQKYTIFPKLGHNNQTMSCCFKALLQTYDVSAPGTLYDTSGFVPGQWGS